MTVLWGFDLWDQFDNVDKHYQHGIDFAEKYSKFVKERASIEQDYAGKLRKLVKGYMPRKRDEERNKPHFQGLRGFKPSTNVEDCSRFSTHKSFQAQLSELNDIAGQHEMVAEDMMGSIAKVCATHCQEMKMEKKKLYQEGKHMQANLESQERSLEQTKKKFKNAWVECEKALANYQKLDSDNDVTKADVEKAKHTWQVKKDSVESCKTDYGASLSQFNRDQTDHYEQKMPKVFQSYAESEARRICKLRDLMVEYAKIDIKVKPIIQKCLDGMEQAANGINAEKDLELVVETLKSGFTPPLDKVFEDYTDPSTNRKPNDSHESVQRSRTTKGSGLSWIFGKKTVEAPDYSHLPPEQRRKKLNSKIEDIRKDIHQEENGKRGMLKMQDVYRANPALGDPNTLEPQIREVTTKIEKLQAILSQHEAWHADASGTLANASPRRPSTNNSSRNNSRPSSTIDVGAVDVNTYEDPDALTAANKFPTPPPLSETADDHSAKPAAAAEAQQGFVDDFEDEIEPVGTCVALYDFDASSEGALSMKAGDKFTILEADNGDGWTRAMNDAGEGYIPTSYVEVNFFA